MVSLDFRMCFLILHETVSWPSERKTFLHSQICLSVQNNYGNLRYQFFSVTQTSHLTLSDTIAIYTALRDCPESPCHKFSPLAPVQVLQSKQEIWLYGFGVPWGKDLSNLKLIWRWCVQQSWWGASPLELMQEDSSLSWQEKIWKSWCCSVMLSVYSLLEFLMTLWGKWADTESLSPLYLMEFFIIDKKIRNHES